MHGLGLALVVAAGGALAWGCDTGGSTPPAEAAPATATAPVIGAAPATPATPGASSAPGPGTAPSGGAEGGCLQGAWQCSLPDGTSATMTISGETINGSVKAPGITATVTATITADGSKVTVVDTGGTLACKRSQRGEYEFTCSDTALSFSKTSDPCRGRSKYFGCDWTKQ